MAARCRRAARSRPDADRGAIIAVGPAGAVSRETQAIVRVDAIVSRDGREPLRDAVTRVLGASR